MEAAHNNGERLDYIVFSMDEILRGVTGTDLPSSLGNSNGNGVRRSRLDRAPTIWRTVLPFTLSFVNSPLPLVHSPLSSLSLMSPPPLLPPLCSVRSGPSFYIFARYQPSRRRQRSSDNRVCLMASLNHWIPREDKLSTRVFVKFFLAEENCDFSNFGIFEFLF